MVKVTDETQIMTVGAKNDSFSKRCCYNDNTPINRRTLMDAVTTMSLTKKYQSLIAVDSLNLKISRGELFALLGVNGAGKTTTVKMLSCLTSPTAGDAVVGGYSVLTAPLAVRTVIGISPQETAVAPNLTVRENLDLMCCFRGFSKDKRKQKIRSLTEKFNLQDILHRKTGKLSGGWQRRVSIAMALIGEPSILFLDEPTLGLDVIARRELWDIIKSLKGQVTVILTTHYMEEAEALSDRVGIMKDGKLLTVGTVQQIKEMTGADTFENAFISIVKDGAQ